MPPHPWKEHVEVLADGAVRSEVSMAFPDELAYLLWCDFLRGRCVRIARRRSCKIGSTVRSCLSEISADHRSFRAWCEVA
jgi:hypothetical protein